MREDAPWMRALSDLLMTTLKDGQPVFGACFGHQLIGQALGAKIVRNPAGWGHGRLELKKERDRPWLADLPGRFSLYGSHIEQVAEAPPGTEVIFSGPDCPVAGLARGRHLLTVQHHPEMTREFIAALVAEYADHVGPEVTARARASLHQPADTDAFAEAICRFFEGAA